MINRTKTCNELVDYTIALTNGIYCLLLETKSHITTQWIKDTITNNSKKVGINELSIMLVNYPGIITSSIDTIPL